MKLEAQPWKVFVVCLGSDLVRVQLSVLIHRVWAEQMHDGASGRVGGGAARGKGAWRNDTSKYGVQVLCTPHIH